MTSSKILKLTRVEGDGLDGGLDVRDSCQQIVMTEESLLLLSKWPATVAQKHDTEVLMFRHWVGAVMNLLHLW